MHDWLCLCILGSPSLVDNLLGSDSHLLLVLVNPVSDHIFLQVLVLEGSRDVHTEHSVDRKQKWRVLDRMGQNIRMQCIPVQVGSLV